MAHRRPRLPLTAVSALAARQALPEGLAPVISDFVTSKRWTIEQACERNDVALLQRLVAHEAASTHSLYRAHVFECALLLAVKHDDCIQLLENLRAYCPSGFIGKGAEEATCSGNLQAVHWLLNDAGSGLSVHLSEFVFRAAHFGQLHVLRWFKENVPESRRYWARAIYLAVSERHFEVAQWLRDNVMANKKNMSDGDDDDAMKDASNGDDDDAMKDASNGDDDDAMMDHGFEDDEQMERVKHLLEHGYKHFGLAHPVVTPSGQAPMWNQHLTLRVQKEFCRAAEEGRVESVQWLIDHSPSALDVKEAFKCAVRDGQLEIMRLFHGLLPRGDNYGYAALDAASSGHLQALQWLSHNLRATCDDLARCDYTAIELAAGYGHLDVVQWFHAQRTGAERPLYSITYAVASGHFEIVKWLLENGRQMDDDRHELDYAAASGNLELLVWLHDNTTATCSTSAMNHAAARNHLHIIKWLHDNRREGCTTDAMDLAASNGHVEVVKWLHANRREGCTTNAMDDAGSVKMVEWLHVNRSEGCTTVAMDKAAMRGDIDTLLFLHANRTEGCTIQAGVNAWDQQFLAMFKWLVEMYPDLMQLDEVREKMTYTPYWLPSLS